jgi:hypothetical protein
MKLVRVRWFNWGQHHDDQGEVHSHRIRYCRSYPVGHRTAGKCDRRFLPWFRIDGQFSAHSNWRVRARARAPNNHSLEAWAPPLGASCIGCFSSRCFKLTADCPQFPLGHAVAQLQELRAPEGETIPYYTRSELLRYREQLVEEQIARVEQRCKEVLFQTIWTVARSWCNYSVRCVLRSLIKHSHGPAVLRPARIVVAYRNWPFLPIRDRAHAFI